MAAAEGDFDRGVAMLARSDAFNSLIPIWVCFRMLSRLRCEVARLWRMWLLRRNRGDSLNWERFQGMLRVFPLFPARIIHSSMQ
jgi:hypothetical protein